MTGDSIHCPGYLTSSNKPNHLSSPSLLVVLLLHPWLSPSSPLFISSLDILVFLPQLNQAAPVTSSQTIESLCHLFPANPPSSGRPSEQGLGQKQKPGQGKGNLDVSDCLPPLPQGLGEGADPGLFMLGRDLLQGWKTAEEGCSRSKFGNKIPTVCISSNCWIRLRSSRRAALLNEAIVALIILLLLLLLLTILLDFFYPVFVNDCRSTTIINTFLNNKVYTFIFADFVGIIHQELLTNLLLHSPPHVCSSSLILWPPLLLCKTYWRPFVSLRSSLSCHPQSLWIGGSKIGLLLPSPRAG